MVPAGLARFHPLVGGWFAEALGDPTPPQLEGWGHIAEGRDTLIAAPTGSGKTLAAFLWALNELVGAAVGGQLEERTTAVYVSPLKALSNDIHANLTVPLLAMRRRAEASGHHLAEIRVAVRTGDTPPAERARMLRTPPHILVTTPESLFILLTAQGSRELLRTVRTVIVDEIHAIAGDKRGAHLALSLERLDLLAGRRCQRIGLSATQKPIEAVAALLTGWTHHPARGDAAADSPGAGHGGASRARRAAAPEATGRAAGGASAARPRDCAIVDVGHRRAWELSVETGSVPLGPVATHELSAGVYDRIAQLVTENRTTLVFVNTRRLVERVSHQLSKRLGEERVAAHHGSLSRELRLAAERGLKAGTVSVVVATASLELGIDIGHVDLVCHLGAPRSLATLLQRVGRSGHWLQGTPRGIIFPLTRDDLVQAAAAVRAARAGELDAVIFPRPPLDILAQQLVALAASGDGIPIEEAWALVQRTHSFQGLPRREFDQVLDVLADGVATKRGRRGAQLHRDRVNGIIRGRRGARLVAITSGGAIPDTADYDVVEEPGGVFVGKVNEDFAIESMAGDIFQLGNTSWRIRRVEAARVRVEDAHGAPPTIPFWLGEAPARTRELCEAVSALRTEIAERLDETRGGASPNGASCPPAVVDWLVAETSVGPDAAEQLIEYIEETRAVLGCVPSTSLVVAERFFDEAGGMQLIIHSPFGARVNRAWGLALRKRFCVTFDFELQAAATDDGILLSLGEQHSFPLASVFSYLRCRSLEATLVQALLPSPMFTNRWRWNATRSLALLRHSGGHRVPMPIQRMRAEDLLAAVFPDQVACQENRSGPLEVPDHPLVTETVRNCLHEAMDLDGLAEIVGALEEGRLATVAVETPAPSAMSHEILNSNPYAFLDDAPLEERRARAVSLRRTDPELAGGIGALDPAAIEEVRAQAWPDVRDADELHDHLLTAGILPEQEIGPWRELAEQLRSAGRVTLASWRSADGCERSALVAAERVTLVRAALPEVAFEPPMERWLAPSTPSEEAVRNIVLGWVQTLGPLTAEGLATRLGLEVAAVDAALLALESTGVVLRGRFTPASRAEVAGTPSVEEWCERGLLARIHRLTIGRLRSEIEPVSAAMLVRFLLRWQHVQAETRLHGRDGVAEALRQLQGVELPAPAWEEAVLPARVAAYQASDLEHLCLSGEVAWGRVHPRPRPVDVDDSGSARERRPQGAGRNTPIAFLRREELHLFLAGQRPPGAAHDGSSGGALGPDGAADELGGEADLSATARAVGDVLARRGASFLSEIAAETGRLPAEVEDSLWELVARGRVSGDGVAGLRLLLDRGAARGPAHPRFRALPGAPRHGRALPAGRWSLWAQSVERATADERCEAFAWQLLVRWGVVVRELLARERAAPAWHRLLRIYRRWEAQGRVRGGRFVAGLVGEQFALPEAIEALRGLRRAPADAAPVVVAAADPLNLVGVILPGGRISPYSGVVIAYLNGEAVEVGPLGSVRSRLGISAVNGERWRQTPEMLGPGDPERRRSRPREGSRASAR